MNQEAILEQYPDAEFLFADGLDEAILGIDEATMRVIYSVAKCIDVFIGQGMTVEEAYEYFDFNTRGAYMGNQTPIWCDDVFLEI
jgi:hypothetical protein